MFRPTYQQQFDKITEAYINDEIQPYNMEFCFCGTIGYQRNPRHMLFTTDWNTELYSYSEYDRMEDALLETIRDQTIGPVCGKYIPSLDFPLGRDAVTMHPNYENALFNGMTAALEVLKSIHRVAGEAVDDSLILKSRQTHEQD